MHIGAPIPRRRRPVRFGLALIVLALAAPGCATSRNLYMARDLRPCTDGYAQTDDGWRLGVRHYTPENPDPSKLPVVLCHGLGLNGTFWTITDDHLPKQLTEAGYEVFVVDMRGSGGSYREGAVGWVNSGLRETILPELRNDDWSMDDQALHDVPAILDYVSKETGKPQVHWVGHSLGGMLMYAFLERSEEAGRVSTFVSMGAPASIADSPERWQMLKANRGIRKLLSAVSTGRIARPMSIFRPPGLDKVDRFYYSPDNVDRQTVDRFYGFTLEDPGPGALKQLENYLATGRLQSSDRKFDYFEGLGAIKTPTLFVVGDGDILADLPSNWETFQALGSPDRTFLRFGTDQGHHADYGHCDLVWSRHAPREIFPEIIHWLDDRERLRHLASPQQ
jgi:pimeloyl-ACP methyl ester carboxylesterase